jgi:hypothetical protein
MGWKKYATDEGVFYNVWKYYRLPENCMKASAWIAVMEGAKLFFCWHYAPPTKELLGENLMTLAMGAGTTQLHTLAGWPGKPNPQFEELKTASDEIMPYGRIIARMTKLQLSPVQCVDERIFNRAFSFPRLKGRVVVLFNANVGSWPAGSTYTFKESDPISIDDDGNLVGYKPFIKSLPVHFTWNDQKSLEDSRVYDIKSGNELKRNANGYRISIQPGSGLLVFVGAKAEAEMLHSMVSQ